MPHVSPVFVATIVLKSLWSRCEILFIVKLDDVDHRDYALPLLLLHGWLQSRQRCSFRSSGGGEGVEIVMLCC